MTIYLTAGLLLAGGLFGFVAAVGMLRLPDMIMRMHASTKAGTLGAGLILAAVAIHFMEVGITLRAAAAILFLLLTAPVAAHVIGRAAYRCGIRLWERTWVDELAALRGVAAGQAVKPVEDFGHESEEA
ncbi:MAG: monovalent cation/H(+) antiporter subunit G [Desulfobacterales bacterium]|jgi:multicomponent Na+:H+ antiporter subunit G